MSTVHAPNVNVFALVADVGRSERKLVNGFTVIELLVAIAVLILLAVAFLPISLRNRWRYGPGITCMNNLAQTGRAFRLWEADNNGYYPMQISVTNGGTMELLGSGKALPHFLVMSNYLLTPKILFCPADRQKGKQAATTFTVRSGLTGTLPFTNDSNLSYFLNLDLPQCLPYPQVFVSGDRNLTNTAGLKSGVLTLSSNQTVWWTSQIHKGIGNILLVDGSVQTLTTNGLQRMLQGMDTNVVRLAVP